MFTYKANADDTAQERRQQAMLDRLAMLHESRVQESSNRRAASAPDPKESVDSFDRQFTEHRERVEKGLVVAREKKSRGIADSNPAAVQDELHTLMLEIGEMEQLVASSTYYLPAYTVRASQATTGRLKDEVGLALSELAPRKKFSFSNRPVKHNGNALKLADPLKAGALTSSPVSSRSDVRSVPGIRNLCDQVIVKSAEQLGEGEFVITDLRSCRVELLGKFRALFIHRVKDCQIFAGPVSGSVMVEEVESSTLMLASHQIRIHSTKNTDFYLRVRSRPIVEHTRDVRFAPYAFHYEGIEKQLEACNLREETGLWESVDDFRWLRSVQSPNWSVLPQSERVPMVIAASSVTSAEEDKIN